MIKPQVDGTIQYIEWLILIDRAHPSFIAGVIARQTGALPCKLLPHTYTRVV